VRSWEQDISVVLNVFRLDRIKRRILVFGLLATLIPCLTVGWFSYGRSKQSITEKLSGELRNASELTVREFNLWLKERLYDLRVFTGSYEVYENLERSLRETEGPFAKEQALHHLKDYLKSVLGRVPDYEELLVVDADGKVVASSADAAGMLNLPPDWLKHAKADAPVVGDPYWDSVLNRPVMTVAVPIRAAERAAGRAAERATGGHFLGVLAGRLNFRVMGEILEKYSFGRTGRIYVIAHDGTVIVGSRSSPASFLKTKLPEPATRAMFEQEVLPLEFRDHESRDVLGSLKRISQMDLDWGVVAEIETREAYEESAHIIYVTLVMVVGLLLGIGLPAYILALTIVRPLDRLTRGAAKVAAGDLDVDLPVVGRSEIGYLTQAFNRMVARLRKSRDEVAHINQVMSQQNKELQELSVKDGLTGLHNRRHLKETLASELARAERHRHPFAVLMIDLDHFKQYNDSLGHPAGDRLLVRIAQIFRESIRTVDYAARYGGEEFLVLLPESPPEAAMGVAERIRAMVATDTCGGAHETGRVTVSIGIAVYPKSGHTAEALIARADEALYEAKRRGRNRVIAPG